MPRFENSKTVLHVARRRGMDVIHVTRKIEPAYGAQRGSDLFGQPFPIWMSLRRLMVAGTSGYPEHWRGAGRAAARHALDFARLSQISMRGGRIVP